MAAKKPILNFTECVRHITDQNYRTALNTLKEALGKILEAKRPSKSTDIAVPLLAILVALEENLKKAFGKKWETQVPKISDESEKLICSFCGKDQKEVRKLIAGPSAYICNECIDLCNDIIEEEDKFDKALGAESSTNAKKAKTRRPKKRTGS